MFCTSCGTAATEGSAFCTGCGKPAVAVSSAASPAAAAQAQVSLDKPAAAGVPFFDVPDGVKGWSWGAFLLNWVWAIGNRTWIGLLALIPYVGVFVAIWLGIKGREMAWKNREWESVEHFNRVQKKWTRWGVGLTIGAAVIGILAAIAIPAYVNHAKRVQEQAFETALADAQAKQEAETASAPAPATAPVQMAPAGPSDSGAIDSNAADLPATLDTVAGRLARATGTDDMRFVTLNGKPLFTGQDAHWQFPMRVFKLSQGRQAILMASSGGRGNSCETLFFFLLTDGNSMRTTPEFGTCSPQGSFTQQGDVITLVLPKMGGMSNFVLAEETVTEDGRAVVMDDSTDPSK